ncbi:MAG TPA: type VI secretion system accessory protein TagJ, partial [Caulobacteraceae bacterium]|nr:type VI secretion system accessory protein TagJ [Caulobacteraceae bacterium]
MTTLSDLLRDDRLDEAIELMNGEVRANPTDVNRRANLAELLCISGNLERADVILDAVGNLDPSTGVGVALFRQLVRAEQARRQFHTEGRAPEFLAKPDAVTELSLKAAVVARAGDLKAAADLVAERDALSASVSGVADGAAFDDFRDLDDILAGHLEVLTSTGKYFWVPLANVVAIELRPPERRRDLIWRRAHLAVNAGPDGEVFLPAIYVSPDPTPAQKLGHETDFTGGDGEPIRGVGLR